MSLNPKTNYEIKGISCGGCVKTLTSILKDKFPITEFSVRQNPPQVIFNSNTPSLPELNQALSETKFSAHSPTLFNRVSFYLKFYRPLLIFTLLVTGFTLAHVVWLGFDWHSAMQYFMAGYFLIFGGLKVSHWSRFVASYRAYDDLARRSRVYAYAYPALEVGLGIIYYLGLATPGVNLLVAALMLQKAYSTNQAVQTGSVVQCACLGGYFSIPVTRVTVFEDLLMALMAILMII